MINYVIIEEDMLVVMYYPYYHIQPIIMYYNPANQLNSHDCIKSHYKLGVF